MEGSTAARRTSVLARQLAQELSPVSFLQPSPCLAYQPPEFHSGIPVFCHRPLTSSLTNQSPSVAELSGDLFRRSAPLKLVRLLGLVQAERDLPYTDDESMLNKFPGRQQSFQGSRHRSMTVGCVSSFKGVRKRKGVRDYLVEIRPRKWKKTIWLGTYNTAEEAAGAYDAGIFYTGKNTKYNFPELKETFPPLPSSLRLESVDDQEEIKNFVRLQAGEAAHHVKNNIMISGESTNLCPIQIMNKELKICKIKTEVEPPDVAATTTAPDASEDASPEVVILKGVSPRGYCFDSNEAVQFIVPPDCQNLFELCESVGEDRSGGFQWAPHVQAVSQSRDLQPEYNSKYAVGRKRSCDAVDEDGLISRLAPSIRKEVEEALSSTLRPLVCALRSREEGEQKHREKLLALETQKLALKRAKLLLERRRIARCQPHPRASSHSGNRVKKNPTTR